MATNNLVPEQQTWAVSTAVLQDKNKPTGERVKALDNIVAGYVNDIAQVLPDHLTVNRMRQLFYLNCKQVPKLLECDPGSLIKALMTAASMGLEPDPFIGHLYLIPFKNQVQVIPGYKGLMQLVRNSGMVDSISCEAVHQNDEFDYQLGTDPKLVHKPYLGERGPIVAFYCVAKFKDGSFHIELMNVHEVEAVRNMSDGYTRALASGNTKYSPWHNHFEEMGKKTVFRRAYKRLPMSTSRCLNNAIKAEDAYFKGRNPEVDIETGEIIDVWAEPSETAPQASEGTQSRLDSFAVTEEVA